MASRTSVRFVCLLVVLGVLAASAATVAAGASNKTYFTFNTPIRMPGILLPAGTYVFDRPSPILDPTVVRVMDRTTSKLHLIAFTRLVHRRMDGNLNPAITLGEAANGAPRTVSIWFPQGETLGHQFIY